MKKKLTFPFFLLLFVLNSCHKEIKAENGGIDIISNVYFDASKGLNKMQTFHISRLNYQNDSLIELVSDKEFPEIITDIYFIKDTVYYNLNNNTSSVFSEIQKQQKPTSVYAKTVGAVFTKATLLNYRNRRKLNDTILFKKKYKRFEINSPWNYTRYYIYPTDTILPYSIYKEVGKDYNGRIERIDSYDKKNDIFVSLQLIPRKNWDDTAKEIFEFNHFVKNRKSE
ncbi:hypothetical protein [Cloacibacterium sp. TD35]|uniref:hypothetical protein n=1 Tax=Cloacibacterium sp. TD35 TaxID=2976818 RepID=UPI00237DE45E|nr:hypothetical protein [Cloacibacterium sp. TD35]WDT67939.1 hypothetical protein N7277_11500 [Cloacibacterium sp. TD35]